jgi:AAHS family 4-hydroxybenzoate transporter-like MFS transporter
MAANLSSIGGLIGAIGGVLLLWCTEKRGPAWIAVAPFLGIPLALWIGSGMAAAAVFIRDPDRRIMIGTGTRR